MKCYHCGYEWQPRVPRPKYCPRCNTPTDSPRFYTPKIARKLKCLRCGYEWVSRKENPKLCPNCQQNWRKPPKRRIVKRLGRIDRGEPTTLDIRYVAGFFDGEGSVSITRRKPRIGASGQPTSPKYILEAIIWNTNRRVLELIQQDFGGVLKRRRPRGNQRKESWGLVWSHGRAYSFLERVFPYLVVKREQAKLGLMYWESRKRSKRLPESEIQKRHYFYERMKTLNRDVK